MVFYVFNTFSYIVAVNFICGGNCTHRKPLPHVTDKFYHNVTGKMNLPKCKHNQMTMDRFWITDCISVLVTLNNYGQIKK